MDVYIRYREKASAVELSTGWKEKEDKITGKFNEEINNAFSTKGSQE